MSVLKEHKKIRMTQKEYLDNGGTRCPTCNSADISADPEFESDSVEGWRKAVCTDCRFSWYDVYKLVGYEVIKQR